MLSIQDLSVSISDTRVLQGVDINILPSQTHVFMGPNGSGKSSLAHTIIGYPGYKVTSGSIFFCNENITDLSIHARAQKGIFLAFQYPVQLPGVQVLLFLQESYRAIGNFIDSIDDFVLMVKKYTKLLGIDESFLYRDVNVGFSGGEKKRLEILQLLVLQPKLAILDEIDSGLDVDGLKLIAKALYYAKELNPAMSTVLITHYQRILQYITPDFVHILMHGKIKKTGNADLVNSIEKKGYDEYQSAP